MTANRTQKKPLETTDPTTKNLVAMQHELKALRGHLNSVRHQNTLLEHQLNLLTHSLSWKVTIPLRFAKRLAHNMLLMLYPSKWKTTFHLWRTQGTNAVIARVRYLLFPHGDHSDFGTIAGYKKTPYHEWAEQFDTLSVHDRMCIQKHIETWNKTPLISIIMPVYNVERQWLEEALDSVINQLYPHWELCIADDCSTLPHVKEVLDQYAAKDTRIKVIYRDKNGHISACSNSALTLATGEYITLLDHDDILVEQALYHMVLAMNEHPDADLFYSDEDKLDGEGNLYAPYFKPDWNPDLFFSQNMFNHLGVYRKSIIDMIGGFREGYEGSQDYDLVLRCLPHTSDEDIIHIPHILYHWRAIEGSTAQHVDHKDYTVDASRKALQDYLDAHHPGAKAEESIRPEFHKVSWPLPANLPSVSLIIPTRNGLELIKQAVDSIKEKTTYSAYEIVIVNNQSDDPATLEYFASLASDDTVRVLDYDQPFNFSAINNFAVEHTDSELLGFINNDIEVITPEWLSEMVSHAIRPEIGAVGAKLYYPDNTIQHGGIVLGAGNTSEAVAGHFFHRLDRTDAGYFARAFLTQSLSAVTGACIIMRRNIFEQVGGFDEENLPVAFNDVDLCLKIRDVDYRIIWTPYAELYHHESATRGYENTPEKQARFAKEVRYMRKRWQGTLDHDPYYNPNLDPVASKFDLAFPPRITKPWKHLSDDD